MRRLTLGKRMSQLVIGSGGSALVLSGCDPTVRDTVLGGVEAASTGLITTFVQAFFESLAQDEEEPPTVVFGETESPAIFA